MATLGEQLYGLALDLRDAEPGHAFKTFSRELLLQFWNEGLCILHRLRPDLFTRSRDYVLQPGIRQDLGAGCLLRSVDANLGPDGEDLGPVHMTSLSAQRMWTKKPCLPQPKFYSVTEWQFDKLNRETFYVHPPVPLPHKFRVRIVCVEPPVQLTIGELDKEDPSDCWQTALVRHYVLSQAYAMDSDQVNLSLAQLHGSQWAGLFRGTMSADQSLQNRPGAGEGQPVQQGSRAG